MADAVTTASNANSLGLRDIANMYLQYKIAKDTGQAQLSLPSGTAAPAATSASASGIGIDFAGYRAYYAVALGALLIVAAIVVVRR